MINLDLDNIFFPSQHITDPKWFAGRKDDIEKALKSLCTPGASMLVFGERGSGKSSFIEMIKLLAQGENNYLLYKYGFHKRFAPDKLKFKTISMVCDEETHNTSNVLHCLITDPVDGIKGLLSSRMEKIESTKKNKFKLEILNLFEVSHEVETKKTTLQLNEETIFEKFTNLIKIISSEILEDDEGLLIIIDEFDFVNDSSKMASLIKKLSIGNVKFLLCGIAESYGELLEGHQSVSRQLVYGRINIHLMSDSEVSEVFILVEENTNKAIRFEPGFIQSVIKKSNRYPYFVQLFGKLAIEDCFAERGNQTPMIINGKHLKDGIKKIGLYEEIMERDYLAIIKENPLKEFIIKQMANFTSNKIQDEEIFSLCYKQHIMQPEPKNTLTNLLAHREPQFIFRERDDSNYVVFKDKLFKIFIHSRETELIKTNNNDEYFIPNKFMTAHKISVINKKQGKLNKKR